MFHWIRRRFWPSLQTSAGRWGSDRGSLHSAALAYYAAFSLFPLCLTMTAVLGLAARISGQVQDQQQQVLGLVRQQVSDWLAGQLQVMLLGVKDQAVLGGTVGIVTLVAAALGIFVQLEAMFDSIWTSSERRSTGWLLAVWTVVYERVVAFLMLLAVGVLVIAVFAANLALSAIKTDAMELPSSQAIWTAAQWLSAIVGNAILLTIIFKTIPRAPVRWADALCGGILTAFVMQIGQHLLAAFLIGDYYSIYGVVGSLIAVMVWFYYASAALFFGAEVVRALGEEDRATEGRAGQL